MRKSFHRNSLPNPRYNSPELNNGYQLSPPTPRRVIVLQDDHWPVFVRVGYVRPFPTLYGSVNIAKHREMNGLSLTSDVIT